jgi:Kef-type K+ transport system membrane component KefB
MLAAAGLAGTWAYKKTRILAIFDDLDTVLLMIPLQILMVGLVWQLGGVIIAMAAMLVLGWKFYGKLNWPTTWPWVLTYAVVMTAVSEIIYAFSKSPESGVGLHIEILLPAFLLGCAMKKHPAENVTVPGEDEPGLSGEEKAGLTISVAFMFLVGLSMPALFGAGATMTAGMSGWILTLHVLAVTIISNIGKIFACFFYKREASLRERLAVSIALFPRGEVGAGVLAISLGYGIAGPFVSVAFLSLALNLVLTGGFIYVVKKLLTPSTKAARAETAGGAYAH